VNPDLVISSPGSGGGCTATRTVTAEEIAQAVRRTVAIIPVWNEEVGIGPTLRDLPDGMIPLVVDNGSTDRTLEIVAEHGAAVVHEKRKGYGSVIWAGVQAIPQVAPQCRFVTFVDGDHADHTDEVPAMLELLLSGQADMVLGSRVRGEREKGALPTKSRFAIWYSRLLIWRFYRSRFTDLGPLRVLRLEALRSLDMEDRGMGWTVEMQAKAARLGWRMVELPARYRARVGHSKISSEIKAAVRVGFKLLGTVLKWRFRQLRPDWYAEFWR